MSTSFSFNFSSRPVRFSILAIIIITFGFLFNHPSSPIKNRSTIPFLDLPLSLQSSSSSSSSSSDHLGDIGPNPPFLFEESQYPPPSHPFSEEPQYEPKFPFDLSRVKEKGMKVPNVVHYVWLSGADSTNIEENLGINGESKELNYATYLAIRSALVVMDPEKIYFHYTIIPKGQWFEKIRPHLTLNQVPTPVRVYDHTIKNPANRADAFRILALQKLGGIYLDTDMYIIKPFDDFMYAPFTMGIEAYPGSSGAAKGLCNAVVISEPNADFLEIWLRSFMEFRHDLYEYNAIIKPWYIARFNHTLVQVVKHEAFFNPTWAENEIEMVHRTNDWDWEASGQYAYHAWHSVRPEFLDRLNPHTIRQGGTSFHNLIKRYMSDEDEQIWDSMH